jgi:branched-chain amino acid transport system permease protein
MEVFIQQLFNAFSIGAIYAMVAVGLTLVLGVLGLLNFAHGEFFMLGAFLLVGFYSRLQIPYLAAVVLATVAIGFIGWAVRKALKLELGKTFDALILLTLGVSSIFRNGALAIWKGTAMGVTTSYSTTTRVVLGALISDQRLLILAVVIVCYVLLEWVVRATRVGKAMRAVSQNQEAASVVGINISRICSITFLIGTGLAGLSGALIAPIIGVDPLMGPSFLLKCFAVVTVGGKGNMKGALIAAFTLAIVEVLGVQFIGFIFRDVFAFLALIVVLMIRPEGLFGRSAALA